MSVKHLELAAAVLLVVACSQPASDARAPAAPKAKPQPQPTPQPTPAGPGVVVETVSAVPLRRLTQLQYDNTVRDLLGLARAPGLTLEGDEGDAGFDANARLAPGSLQLDEYRRSAEDLADRAVAAGVDRLAPCAAGRADAACAADFIAGFGRRAYRRPLAADELDRYQRLYAAEAAARGRASGLGLVLRAMLQSPHFLYRVELGEDAPAQAGEVSVPLTAHEVAARLSYFLWNTMPDEALFAAADANALGTAAQIATMARAMLADPRARSTMVSFHQQWMEVQSLASLERNDPAFTPGLRAAMDDELGAFADNVIRQGDGKLATLLTASFSFVRAPLFDLYGLPSPGGAGAGPVRVDLPPLQHRAGLLSLPAVLAAHAHPDQTSLVHRGLLVRSKLLCTTPPPPPPTVNNTPPAVDPKVSARRRFEQHRADPSCAGCHALMDPLGVTFEAFDAIGRYRTTDGQQPVDTAGELTGTLASDGPVHDPAELARRLAAAPEVRDCVTRQWFRYLTGRNETDADAPLLALALATFEHADQQIPELLVAFTASKTFRSRPMNH
jgi:hypothetical protein